MMLIQNPVWSTFLLVDAMADPGFPELGAKPCHLARLFPKTAWKWEKIGPGAYPCCAPRSANEMLEFCDFVFYLDHTDTKGKHWTSALLSAATKRKLKRVIKLHWKMYISSGLDQMPERNNSQILEDGGLSRTCFHENYVHFWEGDQLQ